VKKYNEAQNPVISKKQKRLSNRNTTPDKVIIRKHTASSLLVKDERYDMKPPIAPCDGLASSSSSLDDDSGCQ
jgi:hypothetical protein